MTPDKKMVEVLHKVLNEELHKDMSKERLAEIYEVAKLMTQVSNGTFVCSKCGGSYNLYAIRGE